LAQQKAGEGKAHLIAVALRRGSGGIVREAERERSRAAVAVHLLRMEIAAERDVVPSLRPSYGVANNRGKTGGVSLESIT